MQDTLEINYGPQDRLVYSIRLINGWELGCDILVEQNRTERDYLVVLD